MSVRVLLVSSLPPPEGGISTWTCIALASPLATEFEIRVLDTAPPDKQGVSADRIFRPVRAVAAVRVLLRAVWLFLRFRPHVVHVNTPYAWAFVRDGAVCWLAWLFGVRSLLHFHGSLFPDFVESLGPWARRIIWATLERCSLLVALEAKTDTYLRTGVRRARVVQLPNPIALEAFSGVPRVPSGSKDRVELLYVGWVVESKGIRELLEAVAEISEVRLSLLGPEEPEFLQKLEPMLQRLGDRVVRMGACPYDRVIEAFGRSDIHVLPSHVEAFPFVVLEAMAAGRPVVATEVGAIPEMVRDGVDGFVVPPRDASALGARLTQLVADDDLRVRMGASGRARVEEHYAVPVVLGRLAEFYRELAEG